MCNLTHDFVKAQMGPLRENMGEYFELAHYHNLMRMLPIHLDGPIALAAATAASSSALAQWGPITLAGASANYFTLAHYFSGRCCQCTLMGPLHQQMLLPIASHWPIIFLEGTANALRWAHCISRCCCRLLHLGPSNLWEALLMHSDRPIASADAAANYFALAHYISGRHC